MRLHHLVLTFLLALTTRDALAACDGCGGSRSTLKERQSFVPKRQEVRGTKVRTKVIYCSGGASCSGSVVYRRNGETLAQHAARVAALKADHERGVADAMSDPEITATIRHLEIEVYDVEYTMSPDALDRLRTAEPRVKVFEVR